MKTFLFLFLTGISLYAEIKTVFILDFEGVNIPLADQTIFSKKLEGELVKQRVFTVIERDQISKILKEQEFQLTGCVNTTCAVEVGEIVGASHMITGTIGLLNEVYWIQVRMIDVATSEIVQYVDRDVTLEFSEVLLKIVPDLAGALFSESK